MDEYKAALVGNLNGTATESVQAAIARNLPGWDVRGYRDMRALIENIPADGEFPDLIVVCQSHRDEFSAQEVHEGLAAFPVARWICVTGAWCESEGRHGSRWPMAVRVPLRALENRLAIEAAVIQAQVPALALTAARDEVYEFDAARTFPRRPGKDASVVAIVSPDRELGSWLSDLCREAGYVIARENVQARLLIVDLDPLTESIEIILPRLKEQHPQAKFLVLMGLVSQEALRRFQASAEGRVLSKLTPAAQLLEAINEFGSD